MIEAKGERAMLQRASDWIVEQLIGKKVVDRKRKPVYRYGCELFLSTACGILCILLLGSAAGRALQALVFILSFVPIRTVANGYHAASYRNCFLLTNTIAFTCMAVAWALSLYVPLWAIWCFFALFQALIWVRGPFRSRKNPLREELIERNRMYMHRVQLLEIASAVVLSGAGPRELLCTLMTATGAVALMICIAEKEGQENVGITCRHD